MPTKKRSAEGYERQKEYIRNWQKRNRGRLAERSKQQRQELRLEALRHYGGSPARCACCDTTYTEHLTVAAMDGDILFGASGQTGTTLYRKLAKENYPAGYRVLCWSCLMAKALYHACPHEAETSDAAHHLLLQARVETRPAQRGSRDALVAH
jgi:hypothetical protein